MNVSLLRQSNMHHMCYCVFEFIIFSHTSQMSILRCILYCYRYKFQNPKHIYEESIVHKHIFLPSLSISSTCVQTMTTCIVSMITCIKYLAYANFLNNSVIGVLEKSLEKEIVNKNNFILRFHLESILKI